MLQLLQIPFSHNSIKVRRALELKGLPYAAVDVNPILRTRVRRVSGQWLLPVLLDDGRAIADSTAILLHLEARYPDPPLLPADPRERAECLVLEEWADATFMALTRRLGYWAGLHSGMLIGDLFFPGAPRRARRLADGPLELAIRSRFRLSEAQNSRDEVAARRAARLAIDRLGGREHLVGDSVTVADLGLASMSWPLELTAPSVREDPAVEALVAWSRSIMGQDAYPARAPVSA